MDNSLKADLHGTTLSHAILYAYNKSMARVVSCKSRLQLSWDCCVWHEKCCGLLKHGLKLYDNHIATGNFISWKLHTIFP